jgi:hypothetical protein
MVTWGCSSVGRALHWQCKGQGFESPQLHRRLCTEPAPSLTKEPVLLSGTFLRFPFDEGSLSETDGTGTGRLR